MAFGPTAAPRRRRVLLSLFAASAVAASNGGGGGGGGGGSAVVLCFATHGGGTAAAAAASSSSSRGLGHDFVVRPQKREQRRRRGGRWFDGAISPAAAAVPPSPTATSRVLSARRGGARGEPSSLAASMADSDGGGGVEEDGSDDDVGDPSVNEAREEDGRNEEEEVRMWPCFDELDRNLIKISLPCVANFAINPLIGAVDLFWVNRMGNALAVAGQAAANQVFNSAFWVFSFLPSVTATLVSQANAGGDEEAVQDAVCQALVVGFIVALAGSVLVFANPEAVLRAVLQDGAPAHEFARPYLLIRSFAFLPNLTSLIGYSAFRGVLDTVTPMKISAFANAFNAILDPLLIFPLGMGVTGAALATLAAEVISAVTFMRILFKRNMIRWSKLLRVPEWAKLEPLLKGGLALQIRNFALNLTFLAVTRVTQSIDDTGVAAAAHALAIQTFQVGGIVLLALSTVAQTVVPNEMIERTDPDTGRRRGGVRAAKAVVNRLMSWGFILGAILGGIQIGILPFLLRSSPLEEVRAAALMPSYLASVYQLINGLVFIGEGVMVGCGNFMQLSLSTLVATMATLRALRTFPRTFGVTGVWMSFGVFNALRLAGVWIHQTRNGPIAPRNVEKAGAAR